MIPQELKKVLKQTITTLQTKVACLTITCRINTKMRKKKKLKIEERTNGKKQRIHE